MGERERGFGEGERARTTLTQAVTCRQCLVLVASRSARVGHWLPYSGGLQCVSKWILDSWIDSDSEFPHAHAYMSSLPCSSAKRPAFALVWPPAWITGSLLEERGAAQLLCTCCGLEMPVAARSCGAHPRGVKRALGRGWGRGAGASSGVGVGGQCWESGCPCWEGAGRAGVSEGG